jgi:hypothetical protein
MTAAAIICSILGGACELAGVALVVIGIRDDRNRARDLFDKPVKVKRPKVTYPGRMSGATTPGSTAWASSYGGSSERAIIKRITDLEASVGNALIKMKKIMDEQDFGNTEALYKAQVEGDNDLRQRLRDVLLGSIKGRVWGVRLLFAGIVLGVAGSVLGTLA